MLSQIVCNAVENQLSLFETQYSIEGIVSKMLNS